MLKGGGGEEGLGNFVEYKIPGAGRCAGAKTNVKREEEREEEREEVITTAVRQQERRKDVRKEEGKWGRTEDGKTEWRKGGKR